jgi:magnesium chelatase family protein
LLDRIDLQVMVSRVTAADLTRGHTEVMNGGEVAKRIRDAHQLQFARSGMLNAHLTGVELNRVCVLDDDAARILNKGIDTFSLSARAYHHVLRISRTLADLENETDISRPKITEALAYRMMDHRPKVPSELLPNPLRTTPARAFR